ncbi:hypothetical protein LguiB_022613 [Lonicera macranthoides]
MVASGFMGMIWQYALSFSHFSIGFSPVVGITNSLILSFSISKDLMSIFFLFLISWIAKR